MAVCQCLLIALLFTSTLAYRTTRNAHQENQSVNGPGSKSTLRQVNLVLRHGHRSPQSTYRNDPYKNDPMEPFGWGQLTSEGRRYQYNQGLFLRQRYQQFLGSKYSPDIFWLQSTAADRAKMSALLEAAALWKPDDDQMFLDGLAWQPAALHYQASDKDDLLLIYETCPDYGRMREIALKSPEIQKVNEENRELYEALSRYSGENVKNPDDVFDIFGTLEAELSMKYKLPDWTNLYFPNKMRPLGSLSLKLNVYNETLLRMKAAPLITKIVNNMVDKSKGVLKPSQRKMFMYVGHDTSIINVLEGMKVWDMVIPSYGIMVIIELHENEQHEYYVQMYLRNLNRSEPYPLTIPGCTFACPLDRLTQLLRPMIITEDEWKQECVLKDPNYVPGDVPLP